MKTFAVKRKRPVSAVRGYRRNSYQPVLPVQREQQTEVAHILRSTDIQTKLSIGRPNDKYEQEADRVADQVMRMTEPGLQCRGEGLAEEEEMIQTKPLAGQITPLVQRQAELEEEEEPIQTKKVDSAVLQRQGDNLEEEEEPVQAKSSDGSGKASAQMAGSSLIQNVLSSPGQSLDATTRSFMEPRFGQDFGGVRVHTNGQAVKSARAVNARAYTVGSDVVFGQGAFSPNTLTGKKLLAHELTHVIQQNSHQRSHIPSVAPLIQGKAEEKKNGDELLQIRKGYSQGLIQRDLATSPPATAPAQAALTAAQIRAAIIYNRRRYNVIGTRLIQDIVGTTPTGTWVAADIRAIAAIQEEYRLKKDGRVGTRTFRFLDNEVRNERLRRTDANCLTSLVINRGPQNIVPRANGATMTRRFTMRAQFPRYYGCRHFEYRQFIRGHLRVIRGRVVHDQGAAFSTLPAGRINTAWQEDGNTTIPSVNFGYRSRASSPDDLYLPNRANGCRYEGEDTPGGNYTGAGGFRPTTGDIVDINVNFRGEIRRSGRVIRSKRWSALRRRFRLPR